MVINNCTSSLKSITSSDMETVSYMKSKISKAKANASRKSYCRTRWTSSYSSSKFSYWTSWRPTRILTLLSSRAPTLWYKKKLKENQSRRVTFRCRRDWQIWKLFCRNVRSPLKRKKSYHFSHQWLMHLLIFKGFKLPTET